MPQEKECRCPVRPYYPLGSMASGSTHEDALVNHWAVEHGHHVYAKARDDLATALQTLGGGGSTSVGPFVFGRKKGPGCPGPRSCWW